MTVASAYPGSDHYYRLRRHLWAPAFHLNAHGTTISCSGADTGVSPASGLWYRFEIQVDAGPSATQIRAKVWEEGTTYPDDWQQACVDTSATRCESGTIGVWSMGEGAKYWDDLVVTAECSCGTNADCDDGLFCNGVETCDPGLGCQPGSDPCPDRECIEASDSCGSLCGDGVLEPGEECDNGPDNSDIS